MLMCLLRRNRQSSQLLPEYEVIRTVQAPHQLQLVTDATGNWRLSSAAYSPSSDGLVSVDLAQLLIEDQLHILFMYPAVSRNVAAASHKVSALRELGLDVIHDPVLKNWYHGGISGIKNSNAGKRIQRQLARSASFPVPINQVEAQRLYDEMNAKRQPDVQS